MPNWCKCNLIVEGGKPARTKFEKAATRKGEYEDILDFSVFIPYPEKFKELDDIAAEWATKAVALANKIKKSKVPFNIWWMVPLDIQDKIVEQLGECPADGYNQGGYYWCIDNWGTKWGACDITISKAIKGMLIYSFDTAWSPPCPVVIAMSEKFPSLKFTLRYCEPGCGFQGELVAEKGKVLVNRTREYASEYEDEEKFW